MHLSRFCFQHVFRTFCYSQLSPGMSVLTLWKVIRNKLLVTCYHCDNTKKKRICHQNIIKTWCKRFCIFIFILDVVNYLCASPWSDKVENIVIIPDINISAQFWWPEASQVTFIGSCPRKKRQKDGKTVHLLVIYQLTQNICMAFVQCWTNGEDVGPTLYKCYTNVLCLLGSAKK